MPPEKRATLLVKNISQLLTMEGDVPRAGNSMSDLGLINSGAVAVSGEEILAVGDSDEVSGRTPLAEGCKVVDARGAVVTPGLVDCHTHPVFAGHRANEFEMRRAGKSYLEIAASGGGIRASVRQLRSATFEELYASTQARFDRMLSLGITTVEAKSGYGLSIEAERKQLEVISALRESHPINVVPTFLGAHDIPEEYSGRTDAYVRHMVDEMIPAIHATGLAEFCDIFTEQGVFDLDQSRTIQSAAASAGFKLKFHADELTPLGGAELAASLGAISADHLMCISDNGIQALKMSGTIAVLLPGTTFALGLSTYAPARKLISAGVPVALATDCNPGSSYSESLPLMSTLAAIQYRMSPAEAISAMTVNAACAIDRGGKVGQLIPGLVADLVVWDMTDYREMAYHYGVNLARAVIKSGRIVYAQ